jgi:prepilin-type N-terminal cleavage/methylation domain-containing protein
MFAQAKAIRAATVGWARDDRGFTLAELLISVAIMLIVATGTLSALAFAANSTRASSVRDGALSIANQQLEYSRNLPYDSLGEQGGDPPGVVAVNDSTTTPQATYTIHNDISWVRDTSTGRAKFKRVNVTVSWAGTIPGSITVSTVIFGKSSLVNVGDLEITTLRKQDNAPLQNTQVTIQPSTGSARTVYTDSAGKAFFGQVPAGAVTITPSNGAYVFDPTQYSGTNITADLLNSLTIYGQIPSSANVHVVGNPSGANIVGATVRLADASSNYVYQTTGSDGIAHFDNLFIGTYAIRVDATGRTAVTGQTINVVTEGSTIAKTIQMTDPANLVVRAVDGASTRLTGATVTVTGPSPSTSQVTGSPGTTGSNGEVSFASLIDGTYTIVVSKAGYTDQTATVVMAGTGVTQIVTLSPATGPGSILVNVTRSNGTVVSGIRVRIYNPSGSYTQYTTDSNGQVSVTGLAAGNYNVTWRDSARVYSSQIPVTVSPGTQSVVNINSYN